jgi:aminoglycoside 2''-phosphotransferase
MQIPDRVACLEKIKAAFTEPVSSIHYNDYGEDFFIIEVNHEWIFRFPRRDYSRKALEVEKKFLPAFQPTTTIPLPDYSIISHDMGGYLKLSGEFLTPEIINNLPFQSLLTVTRQLGEFLSALHSFPTEKAKTLGVTAKWADWLEGISPGIFTQIINDLPGLVQAWVRQVLESYFNNQYQPSVIHGDLSLPDHVLYDKRGNQICGIIDFGDLTIDDSAHDFLSIYEDGGKEFFRLVTEQYHAASLDGLIDRIRIELHARPIFHAAHCIETKNDGIYADMLKAICKNYRGVQDDGSC